LLTYLRLLLPDYSPKFRKINIPKLPVTDSNVEDIISMLAIIRLYKPNVELTITPEEISIIRERLERRRKSHESLSMYLYMASSLAIISADKIIFDSSGIKLFQNQQVKEFVSPSPQVL